MPTSMIGGYGQCSCIHNSSFQRAGLDLVEVRINEGIVEKLDVIELMSFSSPKIFRIADLGCSVGPNTFITVENIVKSVELKYQCQCTSQDEGVLEFQVFFNDLISNDFNTLFKDLPSDRQYFTAGVPGSFQGRLFPKNSLHFVHSSYALQWLANIPKELVDDNSPSYNKGRIFYGSASKEVVEAYSAQFAKDISSFLNARAQELVHRGVMVILIPCIPHDVPPSRCNIFAVFDLLGASLTDMVNLGLVSEAKVDSFNLPLYSPTPQELKALIKKNGCFSIERMEQLHRRRPKKVDTCTIEAYIANLRTSWEGMIGQHFGDGIIDELFDLYRTKVVASSIFSDSSNYDCLVELLVLLKRNHV